MRFKSYVLIAPNGTPYLTVDRVSNVGQARRVAESYFGMPRNAPELRPGHIRYAYCPRQTAVALMIGEIFDAWLDNYRDRFRSQLPKGWDGWKASDALAALSEDRKGAMDIICAHLYRSAHEPDVSPAIAQAAANTPPLLIYQRMFSLLRRGDVPSEARDLDLECAAAEAGPDSAWDED